MYWWHWQSSVTFTHAHALAYMLHHALVNEIHDKYSIFKSMHAKIIIRCSVVQRYHGVFLIFKFDRFFSEPTICFFSGPRGRFFSEPTPQEVKEVWHCCSTQRLGTSSNSFNHLAVSFATCPSKRGRAPSAPLSSGIPGIQAATHIGSWGVVGSFISTPLCPSTTQIVELHPPTLRVETH